MPGQARRTRMLALLVAALAFAVASGIALADIAIYHNDFSSRSEVRELRHVDGKHCSKKRRRHAKGLRIAVQKGREVCGYRPPVQGDAPGPDHRLQVRAKLLKHTARRLRNHAYVGVQVRVGKGQYYELRVFPSRHHFALIRKPSGAGFPVRGDKAAIKGTSKSNSIRIEATGDTVVGKANGTKLAKVTDPNAGEVSGKRLEVTFGHRRKSSKPVLFALNDLKVSLPNP